MNNEHPRETRQMRRQRERQRTKHTAPSGFRAVGDYERVTVLRGADEEANISYLQNVIPPYRAISAHPGREIRLTVEAAGAANHTHVDGLPAFLGCCVSFPDGTDQPMAITFTAEVTAPELAIGLLRTIEGYVAGQGAEPRAVAISLDGHEIGIPGPVVFAASRDGAGYMAEIGEDTVTFYDGVAANMTFEACRRAVGLPSVFDECAIHA